jgi:antagonist of KipI
MADHQTTGGYPRIASVIKADLPKLSQLYPGKTLNFKIISIKEAEDALLSMQQILAGIKNSCGHNLKKYLQP